MHTYTYIYIYIYPCLLNRYWQSEWHKTPVKTIIIVIEHSIPIWFVQTNSLVTDSINRWN